MIFDPDLDYVIDSIAEAYVFIRESLADNNIERAQFWEQQLTQLVQGLEQYVRENPS